MTSYTYKRIYIIKYYYIRFSYNLLLSAYFRHFRMQRFTMINKLFDCNLR